MIAENLKRKLLSKWPIHVHSWGGLGSQIFACIVAKRIMSRFPKRKVVLVFHSSGVTYRNVEINSKLASIFNISFHDDYRPTKDHAITSRKETPVGLLRNITLTILIKVGIVARLNKEDEFDSINSLLTEVRGHYTQLELDLEEIDWIIDSLELSNAFGLGSATTLPAMHLRLGDLLTLKSKTHIDPERLIKCKPFFSTAEKLLIYSDSNPQEVLQLIGEHFNDFELEVLQLETLDVMDNCLRAKVFIGTNSKISLWIAILRLAAESGRTTVLPTALAEQAKQILSSIDCSQELFDY